MLGAIIGDIVGSTREWHNIKTENFELVPKGSRFTDDTVMTLAVAEWLMTDSQHRPETLVETMQRLGRKYIYAGYGRRFSTWLLSINPRPYGSFGNGSAMRVSPVGLYANSLEEALELARITASVSHDHPEGIKGAQAIAGCVFLKKNNSWESGRRIGSFIKDEIGYDLDFDLDELRKTYSFDITCQGSVPIAIKAYLERSDHPAEEALRLAISMGGDSDTIGAMTASIAGAKSLHVTGGEFSDKLIAQCRALLPADLLDINDRFEAFVSRPLHQSYYVDGNLFAGEYPGDRSDELAAEKLRRMHHFGVRHFIDLTEEGELRPYLQLLPDDCTYHRFPIRDLDVPESVEVAQRILNEIDYLKQKDGYTYIHCRGGVGRTGTIVACHLARQMKEPTLEEALTAMRIKFSEMPKSSHRNAPETRKQTDFVHQFAKTCLQKKAEMKLQTKDRIRGSLMAGAAGDALGYTVEFMRRHEILARYGNHGITQFELDREGKALVSDDTQMTLFTACGMLMGVTRGSMRGIGGNPEGYVNVAYLDWYYTQTGKKREFRHTWLRDLPELAHRRAPGNTCLSACESLYQNEMVQNHSKGCGGIMRVAPMALLLAGYWSRGSSPYDIEQMDRAGAEVAAVTHKHPLAFLPAAMLTHLIYRVIRMDEVEVKARIVDIALETIEALNHVYEEQYAEDKHILARLTHTAVKLAQNEKSDAENIRILGEGWTGEEAWAIALYCAVRHIDNVEQALIAAVNHDGDSDSTGSICGNIMGAIYGYDAIKRQRLFCPQGKELEETLELSNLILALADDLFTSCIISEYAPIDTPEKIQWYERYCEMQPVGIRTPMDEEYNLLRFLTAQEEHYKQALEEIKAGRKRSHWIWYIFPQLAVLGHSYNAKYYGISGLDEAKAYLAHPTLGPRLRAITHALLDNETREPTEILGSIDAMKVRSCLTLFNAVSPDDIFQLALNQFYDGKPDPLTLEHLR